MSSALALTSTATFDISFVHAKYATTIITQSNSTWYDVLNFDDESEKENALRGYDMANITFIRTNSGRIVFDVLMCKETA